MAKLPFFLCSFAMFVALVTCRQPLYVGSLLKLTNHWASKYANAFATIWEFAFEEIGNRTDILADYSLHLVIKDTQVIIIIINNTNNNNKRNK